MLSELAKLDENFHCLLLAPPAWGKTSKIINMLKSTQARWLYIAPLRAIVDEVFQKLTEQQVRVFQDQQYSDWLSQPYSVLVTTPEKWLIIKKGAIPFHLIIDEYHLFYLWESFRPCLEEAKFDLLTSAQKSFLLTASMSHSNLDRWSKECEFLTQKSFAIKIGNMELKNRPSRHIHLPIKGISLIQKYLYCYLLFLKFSKKRVLIFVPYRSWVDWGLRCCQFFAIAGLGCKGGEAQFFRRDLRQNPNVQVIFATKVLSHGVNLPTLDTVMTTYSEVSQEMMLQMVARAGRRGEKYKLITMGSITCKWKA